MSLTRAAITKITPDPRTPPPRRSRGSWISGVGMRGIRPCASVTRAHVQGTRVSTRSTALPCRCSADIQVVVHRSLRFVVIVLVVFFRHGARLHAASFEGTRGESRRYARSRVRRHPTHTDPPIYLLIQCNSMWLFYAHTARSSLPSRSVLEPNRARSLARIFRSRKHLAPPVRNARASLTLGGLNALLHQDFFGYSSSLVPIASICGR